MGYLRHMHERNEMNKKLYHAAENELIGLVGSQKLSAALTEVQEAAGTNPDWSRNWEYASILLFAAASIFLLIAK